MSAYFRPPADAHISLPVLEEATPPAEELCPAEPLLISQYENVVSSSFVIVWQTTNLNSDLLLFTAKQIGKVKSYGFYEEAERTVVRLSFEENHSLAPANFAVGYDKEWKPVGVRPQFHQLGFMPEDEEAMAEESNEVGEVKEEEEEEAAGLAGSEASTLAEDSFMSENYEAEGSPAPALGYASFGLAAVFAKLFDSLSAEAVVELHRVYKEMGEAALADYISRQHPAEAVQFNRNMRAFIKAEPKQPQL